MVAALVGALGAPTSPAAGTNATPAWGTGASRVAGHLGVLWVSASSTTTVTAPATPSGWSVLGQFQSGQAIATVFVRVLTGADAAPTVTGIAGVNMSAMLGEFSGVNTVAMVDQASNAGGTVSPVTVTLPAPNLKSGELFLCCVTPNYNAAAVETFIPNFNNGSVTTVANGATNTRNHYGFAYCVTTSNAVPDQYAFGLTTTGLASCAAVGASLQVTTGTVNASAVNVALPAVTVTATGNRVAIGTASVVLGPVTVTAAGGKEAKNGTASVAIGAVTVQVSVIPPIVEVGGTATVQTDFATVGVQSDFATVGVQTDLATASVQED